MNVSNNKRKRESQQKIESVFIRLLQEKDLNEITVSEIIKEAHLNRSTFYANYVDIYDLANKIKEDMFGNMLELYKEESIRQEHSYDYSKLFRHMKENQLYYKTLFKLKFDFTQYYNNHLEEKEALKYYGTTKHMDYHVAFFKAGISAVLEKWLENDCQDSPEEMAEVIRTEYQKKNTML